MQISINHKAYECLRWRLGALDCVFDPNTQKLLAAAVRPADAQYLVELAASKGLPLEQLLEQHPKLLLDADYVKRRAKDAESPEARRARLEAREEGREERLKQQDARRAAREEALTALRAALLRKTVAVLDLREDKAREWREAKAEEDKARDEAREAREQQREAREAIREAKATKQPPRSSAKRAAAALVPLTSEEARQQAKAEGLMLLVADNTAGYFGVGHNTGRSKPYEARVRRGGKLVRLGYFATAEEAALWVGRSPEGQAAAERVPGSPAGSQ